MEANSKNDTLEPNAQESEEPAMKNKHSREVLEADMRAVSSSDNEASVMENTQPDLHFKMPSLIDSKTKPKKLKSIPDDGGSNLIVSPVTIQSSAERNKHTSKTLPQLPYQEPEWGGKPPPVYNFEVLKNGQIVSTIGLSEKSYVVFGRMESCQIVMEHPSVSRFHAVLQYREGEDDQKGFYVYDLESTHGTFLNKKQLRPRSYYRMHVGHMLKLGGSSRVYILQGPEEDEELEDELTITELKAKSKIMELAALAKAEQPEVEEPSAGEGIDWGFGEDATEDPITENPFAVSAPNEDLYIEDPKKTLRGWFEREGYELEYNVEEKGFGHFLCRIELPIDSTNGEAVYAEASVKGKKKEAVVAAALEACRILDRHGVLRQSQHDSRKRKEKDWESQDFYDSDEDTYLDRTGTIERKRQLRKKMMRKDDLDNVETYDSLVSKLKDIEKEITEVQRKLEEVNQDIIIAKPTSEVNSEQDSLEAFMANLQNSSGIDKKAKSQLSLQLSALQQEKLHLEKLVKIAQPTVLPPLQTTPQKCSDEIQKSLMKKIMPMTGAIKGRTLGKGVKISSKAAVKQLKSNEKIHTENKSEEKVEEEEEEEEEDNAVEIEAKVVSDGRKNEIVSEDPIPVPVVILQEQRIELDSGSRLEDSTKIGAFSTDLNIDDKDKVLDQSLSTEERQGSEKKKRQRRANHRKANQDSLNPDYSMWLPPDNQTGDGKTHLNDKFGY